MAQARQVALPPMAPFPEAAWRQHLEPDEWGSCLDAWIILAQAHQHLPAADFLRFSVKDESLASFLSSYFFQSTISQDIALGSDTIRHQKLRKLCFSLSCKLLEVDSPPEPSLQWEFLADFSNILPRKHSQAVLSSLWKRQSWAIEASLSIIKTTLSSNLDAGIKGDLRTAEAQLKRLNHLIHASPATAAFLAAGSDFIDALINGYRVMNPPLRKAIIATTYLCLIGLTGGEEPRFSSLIDVLYSLRAAADVHKAGPTSVNDSLVAELVTITPILKQLQQRTEANGTGSTRAKAVLSALAEFIKAAPSGRPRRLRKRKLDKGKRVANGNDTDEEFGFGGGEVHIHRMSLISEIQDLFPELGAGFVVRLLDEYDENVEEVVSHLLEGTLPAHLEGADKTEALPATRKFKQSLTPRSPPPKSLPTRHNIHDNDAFDNLSIRTSQLHHGRQTIPSTADSLLADRRSAPSKAAILSALAAFDSDDDERDDTYDVEDVGGTVDAAAPAGGSADDAAAMLGESRFRPGGQRQEQHQRSDDETGYDAMLFKTYKSAPGLFARDAATRRGADRDKLKKETGMTDEAIEGWAVMVGRDAGRLRRLERRFADGGAGRDAPAGRGRAGQRALDGTKWRGSGGEDTGTGTETDGDGEAGSGPATGMGGVRGGRGRGRGQGRGRGRGAPAQGEDGHGDAAAQSDDMGKDAARHRKAANRGSRANHNRRDQRARKMARGGFGFGAG